MQRTCAADNIVLETERERGRYRNQIPRTSAASSGWGRLLLVLSLHSRLLFNVNKNLCGRDGRTICGPKRVR